MPDRANAVAGSAKSRVSRALQEPSRQGSSRQELPMRPPRTPPRRRPSRLIACKQMNESCSDHGCRAGAKGSSVGRASGAGKTAIRLMSKTNLLMTQKRCKMASNSTKLFHAVLRQEPRDQFCKNFRPTEVRPSLGKRISMVASLQFFNRPDVLRIENFGFRYGGEHDGLCRTGRER